MIPRVIPELAQLPPTTRLVLVGNPHRRKGIWEMDTTVRALLVAISNELFDGNLTDYDRGMIVELARRMEP